MRCGIQNPLSTSLDPTGEGRQKRDEAGDPFRPSGPSDRFLFTACRVMALLLVLTFSGSCPGLVEE